MTTKFLSQISSANRPGTPDTENSQQPSSSIQGDRDKPQRDFSSLSISQPALPELPRRPAASATVPNKRPFFSKVGIGVMVTSATAMAAGSVMVGLGANMDLDLGREPGGPTPDITGPVLITMGGIAIVGGVLGGLTGVSIIARSSIFLVSGEDPQIRPTTTRDMIARN